MKVLLINGSPNHDGATAKALREMENIFKEEGITKVVAPMNGNTWKQYRTLKYSTGEPNFLMTVIWVSSFISGIIFLGFAEIIKLLHRINNK